MTIAPEADQVKISIWPGVSTRMWLQRLRRVSVSVPSTSRGVGQAVWAYSTVAARFST